MDRATADYTKPIELNPNDADAYFNGASPRRTRATKKKAIANYRKVLEIDQSHQAAKAALERLGVTP